MKKTIYKTIIEVEVLSEEPIESNMSLSDIDQECQTGSYSGVWSIKKTTKIKGVKAVAAIQAQGSSPDFFFIDEEGNSMDE